MDEYERFLRRTLQALHGDGAPGRDTWSTLSHLTSREIEWIYAGQSRRDDLESIRARQLRTTDMLEVLNRSSRQKISTLSILTLDPDTMQGMQIGTAREATITGLHTLLEVRYTLLGMYSKFLAEHSIDVAKVEIDLLMGEGDDERHIRLLRSDEVRLHCTMFQNYLPHVSFAVILPYGSFDSEPPDVPVDDDEYEHRDDDVTVVDDEYEHRDA